MMEPNKKRTKNEISRRKEQLNRVELKQEFLEYEISELKKGNVLVPIPPHIENDACDYSTNHEALPINQINALSLYSGDIRMPNMTNASIRCSVFDHYHYPNRFLTLYNCVCKQMKLHMNIDLINKFSGQTNNELLTEVIDIAISYNIAFLIIICADGQIYEIFYDVNGKSKLIKDEDIDDL